MQKARSLRDRKNTTSEEDAVAEDAAATDAAPLLDAASGSPGMPYLAYQE